MKLNHKQKVEDQIQLKIKDKINKIYKNLCH